MATLIPTPAATALGAPRATVRHTHLSAVIPCHLRAPEVALVHAVRAHVDRVLVVSDGLGADGRDVLASVRSLDGVDVLALDERRGKGWALAHAFAHLGLGRDPSRAVLTVDCDGQHPHDAIPSFIAASARAELVVGDRCARRAQMPGHRRVANAAASRVLSILTGSSVRDSQCGMRLLRGRALSDVRFQGGGYEAESVHLKRCLRAGIDVAWVPIPAIYDGEPSSFRAVRDTARVAVAIVRG